MRPTETSAMLQVDLSTLRGPELRQLLDATRKRGQAKLSYEILQEMEARRARGGQRSSEPRLVGLNLGDPLEPEDEVFEDELAPAAEVEAETLRPEAVDDAAPLRLEREPARPLRPVKPPRGPRPARPPGVWGRRVRWAMLGLLAGAGAGYAFGFWVGTDGRAPPPVAAVASPVQVAAAAPPPPPAAEAASTAADSETATAISPETAPAEAASAPVTPAPVTPAPVTAAPAPSAPMAEPPAKVEAVAAPKKGCAAQATPADQAICGDPRLRRLQAELRQAYAEALAAHEDKATLRERQLAWRDDRDGIADPERLARLYEERIRKLNAATAEALAAR